MDSSPVQSSTSVVFEGDATKAQLVWSALEGHGVSASLVDESFGTIYAGTRFVRVVVQSTDLSAALDILGAQGLVDPGDSGQE